MYKVYAISSIKRNYIYVGLTSNLVERFKRHNLGYEKTTKPYLPFILIYNESCENRLLARTTEKLEIRGWKDETQKNSC